MNLPEAVKAIVDLEDKRNLYIQRNNTPAYISLSAELKEQGVIFTDLLTAAREHSELVQKYFMKDGVKVDEHRLTALHAALLKWWSIFICSEKCRSKRTNPSYFLNDDADTSLFNHVLIVAEENSSVTYVENYIINSRNNRCCSEYCNRSVCKC